MKKERIRLRHQAVPKDYDPGYPRRLSPAEWRALIASPARARVKRLVLVAGLSFGGSLSAQEAAPPPRDREAAVLDVIRELEGGTGRWFWSSWITKQDRGAIGPTFLPQVPIMFGNSQNGVFDAGRARELALQACRIYGLDPAPAARLAAGTGVTVLDGLDPSRKIGFKLRGSPGTGTWGPEAKDEPPETGLDVTEYQALVKEGYRIHVADVNSYPVMDGDHFVPTLAYFAGVVDFLNAAAGGPEVDLSALLFGWRQRFEIPAPEGLGLPEGTPVSRGESGTTFRLQVAATITLRFNEPGCPAPSIIARRPTHASDLLEKAVPTFGRPSVVEVPITAFRPGGYPWERGTLSSEERPVYRLTQAAGERRPAFRIESRSNVIFTPSTFDAGRPFTIEIVAKPGSYAVAEAVSVATLPR